MIALKNETWFNNTLTEWQRKTRSQRLRVQSGQPLESAEGERLSWDCEHRKSDGCDAAVTTDGSLTVISVRGEHCHQTGAKRLFGSACVRH